MSTLKILKEIRESGDRTPYSTLLKQARKFEEGGKRNLPTLSTMQQFTPIKDAVNIQPAINPIETQAVINQAQIKRNSIERMKPPTSLVPESERILSNIKDVGNIVAETAKPILKAGATAGAMAMGAPQAITLGAEGILPTLGLAAKGAAGGMAMDYLYGNAGGQLPGDILNIQNPVRRFAANMISPGLLAGTNAATSYGSKIGKSGRISNKVDDIAEYNLEDLKLTKIENNTKELGKFIRKYEKDLKKIQKEKDNNIFNKYIDEVIQYKTTPENLEKAKKWDNKYGSNIYKGLKELDEFEADIGKRYPFDVDVFTRQPKGHPFSIAGYADYKKVSPEERLNRMVKVDPKTGKFIILESPDYKPSDRILGIRKSSINKPSNAKRVIAHELGHITEGFVWSDEMNKRFTDIMRPQEELIDNLMEQAALKNKDIDWLSKKTGLVEYYNTPTEISQHGITNMRQELVSENIIPDINTIVTPENISQLFKIQEVKGKMNYVSRGFFNHVDKSKTKEIAELMNEYPKAIISGAVGAKILTDFHKTK